MNDRLRRLDLSREALMERLETGMGRFVAELAARFGPPPPVAEVEARRDRMEAVAITA